MKNARGKIYYGMHFYPGVAEYQEEGRSYRVFLNENTIRKMDQTFAARPVFVHHVDEVEQDVNELRKDADGWVVESFFNSADGKHWVKFVSVSDRAERAIAQGMKLSNCYIPKNFGKGGTWNGVSYEKEIIDGEYEHLAIVPNPRYEESVILTPEQFRQYNDDQVAGLKKVANDKEGKKPMKLNFFKKEKVENSIDLESMSVMLPKSKREVSILDLVKEADEDSKIANAAHTVKVGEESMTVGELVAKFEALKNELEEIQNAKDDKEDEDKKENEDEDEVVDEEIVENEDDDNMDDEAMENEDDEEAKKKEADEKAKNKKAKNKKKNEDELEARRKAKAKAERLRNAGSRHEDHFPEQAVINFGVDMVARGKSRYGSN